jgi:hypothetical protein
MQPAMTYNEIQLFKKYISQSIHYAEFGSGGSTCLVDKMPNIKTGVSIESDNAFRNYVQSLCTKLKVLWIDIGETASYGHPKNESMKHLWENYSKANIGTPDTILIDGRFRVACGLQCCLNCVDSIILIHDFLNRPEYHILLNFLDIIETCDSLIVARVKSNNNKDNILELYEQYKYNHN